MEQRSDTNIQPVTAVGAGVDPAYVPGLVNLRAPEAEDTGTTTATSSSSRPDRTDPSERSEPGDPPAGAGDPDASDPATPGAAAPADTARPADPAGADDPGDTTETADATEGAGDGPSLEASDRRASITAGHGGVHFTLDDQEADFRWDEIGAVEVAVPRFGKRFSVIVHTHLGRSYEADAEAPSRTALKEWSTRLDAVLDAYFEEAEGDSEA
ncbi:hypothetical protein [Streptomyces sp. NBC_01497]|uniref:hypothetical protein n=1 Tax=Streptomyces sp. NBC_01497 TaxID=2903885 RepID=UPI002E37C622|nr:hypothetical protein [Streptomyces sp. NBC_01497]